MNSSNTILKIKMVHVIIQFNEIGNPFIVNILNSQVPLLMSMDLDCLYWTPHIPPQRSIDFTE